MSSEIHNIPAILVRGFLESGKTTWIHRYIREELSPEEHLLLLSCEEGEVEYDEALLKEKNVTLVRLEDEEELERDALTKLSDSLAPTLVIAECNVMWKLIEFEIPRSWQVIKRLTFLNGETLGLFLDNMNMRSFLGPILSRCDQVTINRCSEDLRTLSPYKAKLRPMLSDISIVALEGEQISCPFDAIPDLVPYDTEGEVIRIDPKNYVFWYYDCKDHPDRYKGKTLSLEASIKKSARMPHGDFALGSIAITCCEADMSFLGYMAHYEAIDDFPVLSYVHVEAAMDYRYQPQYQGVAPFLIVNRMELTEKPEDVVSY